LSDPLKTFAYPFKTLLNNNIFLTDLSKIIQQEGISKIIMGLPDSDNSRTENIRSKILSLKNQIENKFSIEVIFWDEAFTSVIASERIIQAVPKKSKRKDKGLLDRHAASIILQEYLDSIANEKTK
jgi:putative pre-16S rRNA nuclease